MHGLGNDYVYVDCFQEKFPDDPAELARRVSDRHFGVGGDGMIFIVPSQTATARMRMFNADGSEAEMCGNGIRCVAKYIFDHGISSERQLKIETGAGVLTLDLEVEDGKVTRVRVDMGQPILEAGQIPVDIGGPPEAKVIDVPLEPHIDFERAHLPPTDFYVKSFGLDPRMTCVSMGNPHVVLFCKADVIPGLTRPTDNRTAGLVPVIGPIIEKHAIFPRRINVHIVEVRSKSEVTMQTWERGSGITLACGTGAAAVCVAGFLTKRTDRKVLAHLPGGDLELEWAFDNHVYMTGPATEVFSGVWP
jgi:diaminopimelate epimerase